MRVDLKVDMKAFRREMRATVGRQLPFATAQALTATAGRAGLGWQAEIAEKFDRPTPFTVKSVAVIGARKSNLTATVFVKDIAAQYLMPYVDGGRHFLGRKAAILAPKNTTLNAYGNLPRSRIATLKGRRDIYIGPIRTRSGELVNGVWQRLATGKSAGPRIKGAARPARHSTTPGSPARLKLLIRFSDPLEVRTRLDFYGRAERAVDAFLVAEFDKALKKALETAR